MKKIKLIYLILLLTLNFSCVEIKSTEKETNKPELVATSKTDTLKFTSGIRAIFRDSKGNYWLGSHNEGVSVYFTNTNEPKYEWNKTNGDLWFYATVEDGINRFDGQHMNYLVFPKPKNTNPDNSYGVTGISKDKNGKVWIATYAALFSYDGKVVDIFDDEILNLKDGERLHIRSVLADSKGRIWVGNNGIGVILINGDTITHFSKEQGKLIPTNEFEANTKSKQFSKNTGLQSVFAIEEDSEGNIWFGDRDTGAWKYDGKTLTNYSISDQLSNPMIWAIYKDNQNNLLFGMAEGGVYKFNGKAFDKQF